MVVRPLALPELPLSDEVYGQVVEVVVAQGSLGPVVLQDEVTQQERVLLQVRAVQQERVVQKVRAVQQAMVVQKVRVVMQSRVVKQSRVVHQARGGQYAWVG